MINHIFTIPKTITGREELVVLPRRIFDALIVDRRREADILRWSREAKILKKKNELPLLRSLKSLRLP